MLNQEIVRQRLYNQRILTHPFTHPGDLVAWMGAIQAQNYPAAKWGIGLRLPGFHAADVEQAIASKTIVRTWALRGTLHIFAAADIRWVLALIRPAVIPHYGTYYRRLGLDEWIFARSQAVMVKALQGGKLLTRKQLAAILEENQISTQNLRMNFLLYRAALDGLICFGPLLGKQETITLLDEWLPGYPEKGREEALAELARRFFSSHGPATVKDFAWWSGLTAADAKIAFELVKSQLSPENYNGNTYWRSQNDPPVVALNPAAQLAPDFDEYLVGYADRQALLHPKITQKVDLSFGLLGASILIDGCIAGIWKRTFEKKTVVIDCHPYYPLDPGESQEVAAAANCFAEYLGLPAVVKIPAQTSGSPV